MSRAKSADSRGEPQATCMSLRDDLRGDEYDGLEQVEMSCVHTRDPGSLTAWCWSLVDQRLRCKSLVERKELTTIRVFCIICTNYEFCWQCLQAWKGAGKPSDRCDNVGCRDPSRDTLASCVTKDLPGSEIQGCPSIRACPTCGRLIEHKEKCKYVVCSRCHVEFCFVCLDLS